jgi:hypothetical protein
MNSGRKGQIKIFNIRSGFRSTTLSLFLALVLFHSYPVNTFAQNAGIDSFSWIGPENTPLPFRSHEEMEEFLKTAKITSAKELSVGITKPLKVYLESEGIRMKAVFRYVEDFKHEWDSPKGLKLNYHDSCMFELAAYRLSRLLGIQNIPPTVFRELKSDDFTDPSLSKKFPRHKGTLQAWVESAMTEKDREEEDVNPISGRYWAYQFQMMILFDNLVFNDDRNQGNILIGPDWKIWFIDSTRAFRTYRDLPSPDRIRMCEKKVWERLQNVTDDEIRETMADLLNDSELNTLIIRRHKLVEYLTGLIEEKGSNRVLFNIMLADPKYRAPILLASSLG